MWLSGVGPQYLHVPSPYGPGANGLSALFASISGGHPWIAVEAWRLAIVASLLPCAWGVARVAAAAGANPVEAVVAGVANPAVPVVLVAGVHNDAVMIGLLVAGIGLAVTKRAWWALGVIAVAVTIKAPAALGLLAVGWWCWHGWHRRALAIGAGIAAAVVLLALIGLPGGGGFSWLTVTTNGTISSSFSIVRLAGILDAGPVNLVQVGGILLAALLAIAVARGRSWVGALAIGFAVMALTATHPQPWYLLWAVPLVACAFVDGGVQRAALVVMCAMGAWSILPFGPIVWVAGVFGLVWLAFRWRRSWEVLPARPLVQPVPFRDALSRSV